jgi:ABC-type bacteriocin/lantibiotic exporter with double-glycine peptidase domain
MKKIFKILNLNQQLQILFLMVLILITSFSEILLFLFIQPTIQFFLNYNNPSYEVNFFFFKHNFSSKQLFLFFIIIFLSRNIFYMFAVIFKNHFIKNLNIHISNKIYSSYLNKDYSFFLKNNSSNLISNITTEINNFTSSVFASFLTFLTEIFLILAIISFLFIKFFTFSFILLSFFFLVFFLSIFFYKKKIKEKGLKKSSLDIYKLNLLQKSFYAIQAIKLDGIENYFINKFNFANKAINRLAAFFGIVQDLQKSLWEILIIFSFGITIYISFSFLGLFISEMTLIVGTFVIAFFRLLPSLNRIFICINSLKYYSYSINFIYDEISLNKDPIVIKNKIIDNFQFSKQIELKNVSFQYDPNSPLILDNVNLKIYHNSLTFIKGESGSGKSTLLNIICGLLFPTKGLVLVDNNNINDFLKSYRSKIGYVPQKTLLLEDSILDNIVFGQHFEDLDLNLVKEVISKSKLNKLIDKLPNGLNTIIGERGSSLSGGEQQRIGIARALYKKPEILILDEATSALDEETERLLLKEILELQEFMTIIMVSHKKLEIEKEFELFELRDNKIDHIKR